MTKELIHKLCDYLDIEIDESDSKCVRKISEKVFAQKRELDQALSFIKGIKNNCEQFTRKA